MKQEISSRIERSGLYARFKQPKRSFRTVHRRWPTGAEDGRPERKCDMGKMSKVYKRKGECFRYDYENSLLIWVFKATAEYYEDNVRWQEKFGKNLWDIDEDGYVEVCSVGLERSNWTNKEARNEYLDGWISVLDEETSRLTEDFLMYG